MSLGPAVEGRDAVVCALGTPSPRQASSLLEDGTRNLVAAMERCSVPRLVCVTLLGTADSKRNASPFYRYIILRALAPMVPGKENQERAVRDSGLEWVLIRPPRFTSQRRGQLRVLRPGDKGRVGHVSRHDLARVLIDAAERPDYLHPGDRRGLIAQGFLASVATGGAAAQTAGIWAACIMIGPLWIAARSAVVCAPEMWRQDH